MLVFNITITESFAKALKGVYLLNMKRKGFGAAFLVRDIAGIER